MIKKPEKTDYNSSESEKYWSERGKTAYKYKGEHFYTVTPIPYYYKRRQLLLDLVYNYFSRKSVKNILDFGCGDGRYLEHFHNRFKDKNFYGCDISPVMIEKAKLCKAAQVSVSTERIPFDIEFDFIYCFAVWAHIMDNSILENICSQISSNLKPDSRFLLFEQTGKKEKSGKTWIKRTENFYIDLAKKNGLILEKKYFICFPMFRIYEKFIMPKLYKLFFPKKKHHEKCISANKSFLFKTFHKFLINLSSCPILKNIRITEGNTLFVFKKSI